MLYSLEFFNAEFSLEFTELWVYTNYLFPVCDFVVMLLRGNYWIYYCGCILDVTYAYRTEWTFKLQLFKVFFIDQDAAGWSLERLSLESLESQSLMFYVSGFYPPFTKKKIAAVYVGVVYHHSQGYSCFQNQSYQQSAIPFVEKS
jgi:hypothetical protein